MSDTLPETRLLRFWKLPLSRTPTNHLYHWFLVSHGQTQSNTWLVQSFSTRGEDWHLSGFWMFVGQVRQAAQRSFVDWLIRDRFLIAPPCGKHRSKMDQGGDRIICLITHFLNMKVSQKCHGGMQFCSSWGDIINFVLLSQSSSQWDLTWETILTQAVLGS